MFCFIDFETTGVDIFRDEPIEFGAILCDKDLKIIRQFSSLISLEKKINIKKAAFAIHKINSNDLLSSPKSKAVLDNFFNEFGVDYRFVGWNINFDVSFFRKLCHKNGMMIRYNKINHRHIDVQSICFLANKLKLFPMQLSCLSQVAEYFKIERSEKHSALEDAIITFKVYSNLLTLFKSRLKEN